jgi:ribosomal protein S18 acetylase RimI-like enzyme
MIEIRPAVASDWHASWPILEPVIRTGDVYALPTGMTSEQAMQYWFADGNWVFVAEEDHAIVGSYYLRANQQGNGAHVCNCGYVTASRSQGRGIAGAMCRHSLQFAKSAGFRAMQFNFVVSTNEPAVHLWQKHGFAIVGRLPRAFQHPRLGYVDALVMWKDL